MATIQDLGYASPDKLEQEAFNTAQTNPAPQKALKDMTVAEAKANGQTEAYNKLVAGYSNPTIAVDSLGGNTTLPKIDPAPTASAVMKNVTPPAVVDVPEVPEPVEPKTDLKTQMSDWLTGQMKGGQTNEQTQAESLALQEKENKKNALATKMATRKMDYENQIIELEKNAQGGLEFGMNAQINKLNQEASRELANWSIQYDALNNDFISAQNTYDRRVADIKDERNYQMNVFSTLMNFMQNDMTESEKLQAQQAFQEKQDIQSLADQKEMAEYNSILRRDEAKYEAGLKGTSTTRDTSWQDINGQRVLVDDQTGEILSGATGGGSNELVLAGAQQNIDNLDALLSNDILSTAVGANPLGRISYSNIFTGKKDDFVAKVDQITSNLSLDTLIQAKAKGATFGALSDTEMKILASAATTIASKAIKNKDGKVTGYRGSEKAFKEELQVITNFAKLDYLLKGGKLEDVGATEYPDGSIFVTNSNGTITQLR